MRLLCVATGNGRNPDIGGSLMRTIEVAREAKRQGHEVHFLVTQGSRLACEARNLIVPFHELPSSFLRKNERGLVDRISSYLVSTSAAAARATEFSDFDVVYSDSDYLCDTIPSAQISRRYGVVWAAMIHHRDEKSQRVDDRPIRTIARYAQNLSFRVICRYASAVMLYDTPEGDSIADHLRERYNFKGSVVYVKNGINLSAVPRAFPIANCRYDACFLGGLRPSKGIFDLPGMWARVQAQRPRARLAIIGGGLREYERAFHRSISELGIEKSVDVLGALPNEEALNILAQSKVFVSPSYEEGWGIAILEALAIGVPVVAYDLPAYSRTFRDVVCLVKPQDIEAFAADILRLLDESTGSRQQRIETGKQRARLYAWDRVVKHDLSSLRALCDNA